MKRLGFKTFIRNETGATAVEFAVVSGIFFTLMMGIIEFGMFTMTQVALESAVTQAGRATAIGMVAPGSDRVTTVKNLIMAKTSGLMNAGAVTITAAPVSSGGTTAPDLCLPPGQPPSSGACPAGTPFQEVNGINGYQGNGTTTLGAAGDLVEVRVNYPWRVLFPILGQFFGANGVVLISSTTVVKNEPF
jgi:Flp pilus assembly protein TadG